MPEPSIAVPVSKLRSVIRLIREGQSPKVNWSESREKMDTAATRRRSEIFEELDNELSPLIPE